MKSVSDLEQNLRRDFGEIKTLVIKIGSSILSSDDLGINEGRISTLVEQIATLKQKIPHIIIVSSGAVACGFKILGFKNRPKEIVDKQASAALGQARLMWIYQDFFSKYNINVAQILLTKDDLSNRKRYLHAQLTLRRLLDLGVVPIINENDSILVDELKYIETFGDNDNLSALVAGLVESDLLLILSDVDGLYTADPSKDSSAKKIDEVVYIDEKILNLAGGSISNVGTGGMKQKLNATKKALEIGCDVAIIKGLEPHNIERFFQKEKVGTYFSHSPQNLKKRKFWLGYATIPRGKIIVDDGAKKALLGNKSLLPKGVCAISGKFKAGDVVVVQDCANVEIARGRVRYDSSEIAKILGRNSSEISEILGYKICDEIIHKDDLILV